MNNSIGLDFSKDMYAALASLGFTLVFATVSLFLGSVTDRFSTIVHYYIFIHYIHT